MNGVRWVDFRKTLTPRYAVVWRDVVLCYLFLACGALAVVLVKSLAGPVAALVAVVPAAVWLGYWLHSLFLFGHEAAHSNLAPRRRTNDRLGDWLVWLLFGSTTANYRRSHMTHHSHLGDHQDTEITYHQCLSIANMLKALTGIHVLEVLLHKKRLGNERRTTTTTSGSRASSALVASLRSVVVHVAVVVGLFLGGGYQAVLAWVLGVGGVFPLCATLRTVVEHRRIDAPCAVDFSEELHGPFNRLFGTGFVSRTFGSAGFNQHLLHHWDPAISYTRFDSMEKFLVKTTVGAELESSRTSYVVAFRALMAEARRG